MSWDSDLAQFSALLGGRARATFEEVVTEVQRSVVEGSPLTGAKGQPVGASGDLKGSWSLQRLSPWVAEVSTNDPGARTIEKGKRLGRRLRFRGGRGGAHSVRQTRVAFRRLVRAIVLRVGGSA